MKPIPRMIETYAKAVTQKQTNLWRDDTTKGSGKNASGFYKYIVNLTAREMASTTDLINTFKTEGWHMEN